MVLDKIRIGFVLMAWAFFLSVGSLSILPLILMIVGTILYIL